MNPSMKKFFSVIVFISLCAAGNAQIQLSTKQYVLSDFREKTLNVVLTGNEFSDAIIRSELPSIWTASAYEFCSVSDFEKRKKSPDWYFLTVADSRYSGEQAAGIKSICIFKGCPEAKEGVKDMYKVVSIPYCPADNADGSEAAYFGPLLNILQNEVLKMMGRPINLGSGVTVKPGNSLSRLKKKIIIDSKYIQQEATPSMIAAFEGTGLKINPQDDSDTMLSVHSPEYAVGYSVFPDEIEDGSICFNLVIDASTGELCYLKKSKLEAGEKGGFTEKELKHFSSLVSK